MPACHRAAHAPPQPLLPHCLTSYRLYRLYRRPVLQDNFYVLDLGALQRLYRAWMEAMPRVHPHYAVKCNPDTAMLATLAALGAGFDCASEAEIRAVGCAAMPWAGCWLAWQTMPFVQWWSVRASSFRARAHCQG